MTEYKKEYLTWYKTLLLDIKYHEESLKVAKERKAQADKALKKMK